MPLFTCRPVLQQSNLALQLGRRMHRRRRGRKGHYPVMTGERQGDRAGRIEHELRMFRPI